jgi:hypothetical protein
MIALPPGCAVAYEIQINVRELTDGMGEWFNMIGGQATATEYALYNGHKRIEKHVQYGRTKPSYARQDGTGITLIRFAGEDASTASVFLLKFFEYVESHNLKEALHYDN